MTGYTVHTAATVLLAALLIAPWIVGAIIAERRATIARRKKLRATHARLVADARRADRDAALDAASARIRADLIGA
jgi:hypothetical protein